MGHIPAVDDTSEYPDKLCRISAGHPYIFYFGPFKFFSAIDIPELQGTTGSGTLHVTLGVGGVPDTIPKAHNLGEWCSVSAREYLLNVPNVARYYVANGNEVRVEMTLGTPISDVSTYLLGSVFGALCHQNALLPLHASAIESKGLVTAFLGESGAGKSTTAAALQHRGYRVVSDDICLLEPAGESMRVVPVASWLKLWRQSLDYLGETPEERNRTYSTDDKYRVYLNQQNFGTRKIANLVFLRKAVEPSHKATLEPLSASETIAAMMDMTYLSYVNELTGAQSELFLRCARVLSTAHGYRLTIPWNLNEMESVIHLIESRLLKP